MKVQPITTVLCLSFMAACGGIAFDGGGQGSTGGAGGTGGTSAQGGSTNAGGSGGGTAGAAGIAGSGGHAGTSGGAGSTGVGGSGGLGGSAGSSGTGGRAGAGGTGGVGGTSGSGGTPDAGRGGTGGSGGGDGGKDGGGQGACSGGASVVFQFFGTPEPPGYCVNSQCNPTFVTVKTRDGAQQSVGSLFQGCQTTCDVCMPILCPAICLAPRFLTVAGVTQSWDGTYYPPATCGSGISCASPRCTAPGTPLIATMCGTLSAGFDAGPVCQGVGATRCIDVPFDFPANGTMTVSGYIAPVL